MDLVSILENLFTRHHDDLDFKLSKHISFGNGKYFMSVQASRFHYCFPKMDVDYSEYTQFEVMLIIPSYDIPHLWMDEYHAGDNVFAYVPKKQIEKLIVELDNKYKMDK